MTVLSEYFTPEEYYDQKLATEAEKWMRQILNFVESQP